MAKNDFEKYCFDLMFNFDEAEKPKNTLITHLDMRRILKIAMKYAVENNIFTENEVKEQNKNILQSISKNYRNKFYGDNYLSLDRKQDAAQIITKFINNKNLSIEELCEKEDILFADFEEYANVVRFTNTDLYAKYKEKTNVEKEEKKFSKKELEMQEYCYRLLERNNWSTNSIYQSVNIPIADLRNHALNYALYTLNMTKDEFYYEKYIQGKENKKPNCSVEKNSFILFEELSDIDISDEKSIIFIVSKYFKEYNVKDMNSIKSKAYNYAIAHRNDDKDIDKKLKNKIQVYNYSFSKQRKSEAARKTFKALKTKIAAQMSPEIEEFFNGYLESKDTNFIYRSKNKVSTVEYVKKINFIQRNNQELYEKVMKKKEEDKQNVIIMAKNIAKIKKEKEDFDLFDYYHYCDYIMSTEELKKEIRGNLTKDEMQNISEIGLGEKIVLFDEDIQKTLLADMTFTLENGEVHQSTEEEKQMVFDYIKSHGFPFSHKLYNIALKRCAMNRLYEYEDNKSKKR